MKKELLLETAEALFAEKGFEGTSVRDLAQKAGVNVAMISYYFGSKEKLFEALVEYRIGNTIIALDSILQDRLLDPPSKLEKMIDYYVEKRMSNVCFQKIIQREISLVRNSTHIHNLLAKSWGRNLQALRQIIQEGQRQKIFRKVDIEMTMATLMGTITQVNMFSKEFYSQMMELPRFEDNEAYRTYLKKKLKIHLKDLLRKHLDIKKA